MRKNQNRALGEALAVTLIRMRDHRGLSQHQLAEKSGLSRQYISMLERQMRSPNLQTLMQICDALSINERDFLLCIRAEMTNPESEQFGYRPPPPLQMFAAENPQANQERWLADWDEAENEE